MQQRNESGSRDLISVVLPVLNAATTLADQLGALSRQDYPAEWELLITDNGSDDGSRQLAQEWVARYPTWRLVDAADQPGANHARNRGVAAARGDRIIFCDADDIASSGWITAVADALNDCHVVGGMLERRRLNDPVVIDWQGERPTDELPVALRFLPYAQSANLGIRAEVLRQLEGWDESFRHPAGDDVDLCWRTQLAGFRLCYEPRAVMHYRLRPDLRATARQAFLYGKADVQLYRRYRGHGVPRSSVPRAVVSWVWIVLNIYRLGMSRSRRGRYLVRAAYRFGRLRGSLAEQTLFL